jgi:hypothetical protein
MLNTCMSMKCQQDQTGGDGLQMGLWAAGMNLALSGETVNGVKGPNDINLYNEVRERYLVYYGSYLEPRSIFW